MATTTKPGERFAGYTTLYAQTCCSCGVLFAIPSEMDAARQRDGKYFYCPNGHPQHYMGETHEQQVRRLKNALASERARHDQTQASLSATRGVVTKQRKRLEKVVAGVCPVDGCKRHFKDLRRHVATKHPDYHGQV